MPVWRAAIRASGATAIVGAGTAANRLAGLRLSWVAATPRAVGEGKIWLLVTSGLLADDPWLPSLLGFLIVLVVALCVLSTRSVALVGLAGQVVSALVVYSWIGLARLFVPAAFASVVGLADFGVSAMIAGWIGAVADVAWHRFPTRHGRLGVVAACLGCLAIGLACRPDLTFLDAEHLVAFTLGVALVDPALRQRLAGRTRRLTATMATLSSFLIQR